MVSEQEAKNLITRADGEGFAVPTDPNFTLLEQALSS